jgi:hypothetical protein
MSRQNAQNNINQSGKRENENPDEQAHPNAPRTSTPRRNNMKRQGKAGQPNFIPGAAPVGESGRTKPSGTRRK